MEKKFNGFPSDLIDPSQKETKEYCMEYAEAFHNENKHGYGCPLFRRTDKDFQDLRDLARGKQSVDQYKTQLGVRKGRNRKSFKSLDWSILPIAPKFVNLLVGKVMNSGLRLHVKTIDKYAKTEQRDLKNKIRVHMALKEEMENIKIMTGKKIPMPVHNGMPMPENPDEIDGYVDMFYRDELAMEFHDIMQKSFELSDLNQHQKEAITDAIELGVGGLRSYIDSNGMIKHTRIVPEQIITNNVKHEDFRDLTRAGQYIELSISELKAWAGSQFTEEEYQKIAEQASNKSYGGVEAIHNYYDQHNYYPYDRDKVIVLDSEWFSTDRYVYQVKPNGYGNKNVYKKNLKWWNDLGVTRKEYQQRHPERDVMFEDVKNVYRCMWIVDTKFAFNYGLKTDVPRAINNVADTKLGFTIYTTQFDSIIRMIEPVLHNIQLNWLQFQNHVSRSRPSGLEIEMSALENISIGKGQKMTPKEALQLYLDTGILVWRRKQWSGASNQWRPINELNNGISDAADKHLQFIVQNMDILRSILGVNEIVDSSTPNPEIGKAVAEIASQGTNNAVYYLFHAHKKIYQGVADQTALQIPAMINKAKRENNKGIANLFGEETIQFFSNHNDLNLREMGVSVEEGIDMEKKQRIAMYVQRSLDKQELTPEDAMEIEEEDNLHRAAYMLRIKRQKRAREAKESQMEMYQAEIEKNTQSAQASAEAEKEKISHEYMLKAELEERMAQIRMEEERQRTLNELMIKKYERGEDMNELEEQRITELLKAEKQGLWNLRIANVKKQTSLKSK